MSVFGCSIIACFMILIILAARSFLLSRKLKVKKEAFVILWLIVLLRLCLPLNISLADGELARQMPAHQFYQLFSEKEEQKVLQERSQEAQYALLEMTEETIFSALSDKQEDKNHFNFQKNGLKAGASANIWKDLFARNGLLSLLWIIGTLVCLLKFVAQYFGMLCQVNQLENVSYETLEELQQKFKLKRRIDLKLSDGVVGTAVYGVLQPKIVVPKEALNHLDYILLHELAHIKRWDNLKQILANLALAIHWFNPLVWYCRQKLQVDIEMACDEKVLSVLGQDERKSYAYSLYEFALKNRQSATCGFAAFGENPVKTRVKNILNFTQHQNKYFSIILVTTLTLLLMGCLSNPVDERNRQTLESAFLEVSDLASDENIVDFIANDTDFYYLTASEESFSINQYHINTGQQIVLWQTDKGKISGLHYVDQQLYFVYFSGGENRDAAIMAYNLENQEAEVLHRPYQTQRVLARWSYNNIADLTYGDIFLSGDDDYLCWHESYSDADNAHYYDALVIWDIGQKTVDAELKANNQQLYADIINGYTAYQRYDEKSHSTQLVSYHIATKEQQVAANVLDGEPFSVYSSGEFLVYKEDFIHDAQIIVHDLSNEVDYWFWSNVAQTIGADDDQVLKKALAECQANKWGIKLLGNYLVLAGESTHIISVDLNNFVIHSIENNDDGGSGFYYPKVTNNQMMAIENFSDQQWLFNAKLK